MMTLKSFFVIEYYFDLNDLKQNYKQNLLNKNFKLI